MCSFPSLLYAVLVNRHVVGDTVCGRVGIRIRVSVLVWLLKFLNVEFLLVAELEGWGQEG